MQTTLYNRLGENPHIVKSITSKIPLLTEQNLLQLVWSINTSEEVDFEQYDLGKFSNAYSNNTWCCFGDKGHVIRKYVALCHAIKTVDEMSDEYIIEMFSKAHVIHQVVMNRTRLAEIYNGKEDVQSKINLLLRKCALLSALVINQVVDIDITALLNGDDSV